MATEAQIQAYQKKLNEIFQYLLEGLSELAHSPHSMMSAVISLDYARAARNSKALVAAFQDLIAQGQLFYQDLQEKEGAGLLDAEKKQALDNTHQMFFRHLAGCFKIISVKAEVNLDELLQYQASAKPDPVLLKQLQELKGLTWDDFLELIVSN